jgi:hypothetical protein
MATRPARPLATLGWFLFTLLAWTTGSLLGAWLIDRQAASPLVRGLGVAVAVCSALAWGWLVIQGVRRTDEFGRHIHMLALCIAFGGIAFSSMVLDWLQRGHFAGPIEFGGFAFLAVWLWWVPGLLVASRLYR